jgi:hypothetical protein
MSRRITAPYLISSLLAASSLLSAAALLLDPDPFAPGAAGLIAIGLLAYTVIAVAGMLLVRAPWARWLGLGATIGAVVVTAITGFDSARALLVIGASLVAVAALAGPWLTVWLRQRPGTGPEPKAVALPLVALGAAPVAGFAAWSGLSAPVLLAAVLGPVAAWGYSRARGWGLWTLRVAYPITAVVAATQVGWAGAILFAGHGLVVAFLAWSPEASRAQRPIGATLPAPRYRRRTP